jgi:hypothetical protein
VGQDDLLLRGRFLKKAYIHAEEWSDREVSDPSEYVEALKVRRKGWRSADLFTFSQQLPNVAPRFDIHSEWDSVAVAKTAYFDAWWKSLPQETRKNVRRSEKRGVIVKRMPVDDELIVAIMGVNDDSPVRQGKAYHHYCKTFEQVRKDQESFPERSEYLGAFAGDELIGFIKLVRRKTSYSILQILTKASHADKRPANALISNAVRLCEERGVAYLTYGLLNYGNKRDSSLRDFKIRNGFDEILVPRYYVPLSAWGRIALETRIHRGLLGILPPAIVKVAVAARGALNRRQLQAS